MSDFPHIAKLIQDQIHLTITRKKSIVARYKYSTIITQEKTPSPRLNIMENSLFGTLPPELRNNIYANALISPDPIIVTCEAATARNAPRKFGYLPGLIGTCKQIRAECSLMFFRRNTFQLQIEGRPAATTRSFERYSAEARHLWAWLDSLGRSRFAVPQKITLRLRRNYTAVTVHQSPFVDGREMLHQLEEIAKFQAGRRIESVQCVVESSWGPMGLVASMPIDVREMERGVRAEFEVLQKHWQEMDRMAACFHAKVFQSLVAVFDARRARKS